MPATPIASHQTTTKIYFYIIFFSDFQFIQRLLYYILKNS